MAPPSIQSDSDSTLISDNDKRYANVKWDELGFGLTPTDYMYMMKSTNEGKFSEGHLATYGNIELSPSSVVLNYGQGLFEGLKVYRREDDRLLLFRPDQNALRMQMGAKRLLMPSPSIDQFVDAVKQIAIANKRWVPPHGKGTLYVRPLLFGSGAVLGIAPAPECTFLMYASPIGNYYKHEKPLDLLIEDRLHRASTGGTGGIKSITNYSPVFESVTEAKANGYSDVLFLDATTGKYIEELSSCNVFIVKGNVVSTPATKGTILSGITRKSIMEIALDFGYKVEESEIPVEDVLDADEVFCTGTAVIVTPVGSITYKDERVEYRTGEETVSYKLRATLTGIQTGLIEDTKGWTVAID